MSNSRQDRKYVEVSFVLKAIGEGLQVTDGLDGGVEVVGGGGSGVRVSVADGEGDESFAAEGELGRMVSTV